MILSFAAAVSVLAAGSPDTIDYGLPKGWREPGRAELARAKARGVEPQLVVSGDFDADGLEDQAMLLVNDREQKLAVFLQRGAGGPPVRLSERAPLDTLWDHGLSVTPPGRYATACSKGVGETLDCQPEAVLTASGVTVVSEAAGRETIYWTARGFQTVVLSD